MPPISFHATVNQVPREIFMSFALLNRLTYLVGGVENLAAVMTDPQMREAILCEMLAERTLSGKLIQKVLLDEVEISLAETMGLLEFVVEHLLDFFTRAVTKLAAMTAKYQPPVVK